MNKYITCIGLLLRLLVSQQQTVLSFDPDTTTEESSLYTTQFTAAACCRNLRFTLPSDTSHNTTDLSAPHDANSLEKRSLNVFNFVNKHKNFHQKNMQILAPAIT